MMGNLDNVIITYWIIKIGNLYYVGGLKRKSTEYENAVSYEFTNEESLAFPILLEDVALKLANKLGGTTLKKDLTSKDLNSLQCKNEVYTQSENVWENDQQEYMKKCLIEKGIEIIKIDPVSNVLDPLKEGNKNV